MHVDQLREVACQDLNLLSAPEGLVITEGEKCSPSISICTNRAKNKILRDLNIIKNDVVRKVPETKRNHTAHFSDNYMYLILLDLFLI